MGDQLARVEGLVGELGEDVVVPATVAQRGLGLLRREGVLGASVEASASILPSPVRAVLPPPHPASASASVAAVAATTNDRDMRLERIRISPDSGR
jgi:hypothetical protein